MTYRVCVVGGGQLARMMAAPAAELELSLRAVVDDPRGAAAQVITDTVVADPGDLSAMREAVKGADVVTFEHEHIPQHVLHGLAEEGVNLQPSPQALLAAQDKIHMRRVLTEAGVSCPAWRVARNDEDIREFGAEYGWPIVVKTPTGGYDGKGVLLLEEDDAQGWAQLTTWLDHPRGEVLVEQRVAFRQELAVISARRPSGQFVTWPVVQTTQHDGVCAVVHSPAVLSDEEKTLALRMAHTIASTLEVTGVLAVEMFHTEGGELLVNELAMRPHNSGHLTIEGSLTSQFEQHLRAVLDLPLGATQLTAPHAVMVNVLGSLRDDPSQAYPDLMRLFPEVKTHLYGKQVRPGRKLGHVTAIGQDPERLFARANAAAALLQGTTGKEQR